MRVALRNCKAKIVHHQGLTQNLTTNRKFDNPDLDCVIMHNYNKEIHKCQIEIVTRFFLDFEPDSVIETKVQSHSASSKIYIYSSHFYDYIFTSIHYTYVSYAYRLKKTIISKILYFAFPLGID